MTFKKWNSVLKKLPKYGKVCLVYTRSGETYSGKFLGWEGWTGLCRDFGAFEVTHWRKMPKPPKIDA